MLSIDNIVEPSRWGKGYHFAVKIEIFRNVLELAGSYSAVSPPRFNPKAVNTSSVRTQEGHAAR
jgi:hypothetical protein